MTGDPRTRAVLAVPVGGFFWVHWQSGGPCRALWERLEEGKIIARISGLGEPSNNPAWSCAVWEAITDVRIEPADTDEALRLIAIAALGGNAYDT